MQSSGKVATIISIIALGVSIINIALTSPVITDIYLKPNLSVTEVNRKISGDTFLTHFVVKNEGSRTASNIELVINAHDKDIISPMQGFTGEITEKENGEFKTVTLKAPYLPPNDIFIIIITGSKKRLKWDSEIYNTADGSPANLTIPFVVSIKSAKGMGKVHLQPPWFM